MNIFYLSHNPIEAAEYHNDKHVVKMVLESAQLLSTAHRILDGDAAPDILYRATHKNHPSAVWVRQSINNYQWLYDLFCALCDEYTYRYTKVHLSDMKLRTILTQPPINIPNGDFTQPPQAMPDDVKHFCSITAYRSYYIKHKAHIASWTKRPAPSWFQFNAGECYANV